MGFVLYCFLTASFNGFFVFSQKSLWSQTHRYHLSVSFSCSNKNKPHPTHPPTSSKKQGDNQIRRELVFFVLIPLFIIISSASFTNILQKNMEEIQNSKPCSGQDSEAKSKPMDIVSFDKSLQELKDLRSQLHYAADYCESTFLNAKEKKVVMDNTKEYVCRAVVTVVDHLGCVSANLNGLISETNAFSETELRIDCLKQRLFLCEQYSHKLALPKVRWREILPRHNARFLSALRDAEKTSEDLRDPATSASRKTIDNHEFDKEAAMPLFLYTLSHKPSLPEGETNSALVPVRDGLSILSRGPNPTFHFQESRKNRRLKKSGQGHDILSLIRRAKRTV